MINKKKTQTIERIVLYIIILIFSINIAVKLVNYKSPYICECLVWDVYILFCHWNRTRRYQTS